MEQINELAATEIASTSELATSQARAIVVTNDIELQSAGVFLRGLKSIRQRIKDTFDGPIAAANKAHKEMIAAKKKHDGPVQDAEVFVKGRISSYHLEQDRIRRDDERKRQEEEAKRAREAKEEEDRRLAKAVELENAGKPQEAEAVLDAPVAQAPKHAAPTARPAAVSGVRVQTKWKWRFVDESKVPREYLQVDEVAIGKVVRAMKGNTSIPGIEAYEDKQIAASSL